MSFFNMIKEKDKNTDAFGTAVQKIQSNKL